MAPNSPAPRTYLGRFYILAVAAFLTLHQNTTWIAFSTIPQQAKDEFDLSDDQITILAAYGPIGFIPLILPFMWFLERYGLRVTMVLSSWVLAIGCGIRCVVPTAPHGTYWITLIHIGQLLNGFVGVPIMTIPTKLSSVWFPPKERTFATAVTNTAQALGVAIGFITIPYLTRTYDIHTMLYVEAEIALFIALLATIYFPSRPPTPPSVSADEQRSTFSSSLKALMTNKAFILLAGSGGIAQGAMGGFSSILSIVLSPQHGFSDRVRISSLSEFFHSNAWLGAIGSLLGVIGGQALGLVADRIQKKFKLMILIFVAISTVCSFWFAVSLYNFINISDNAVNIFITYCVMYFFTFGISPIYYEAAVEITYPVPEGSSAGILATLTNISSLVLQVVALCKVFSTQHPERALAMSWVLGGLFLLSWILMVFFRENYRRLDIDIYGKSKKYTGIQEEVHVGHDYIIKE